MYVQVGTITPRLPDGSFGNSEPIIRYIKNSNKNRQKVKYFKSRIAKTLKPMVDNYL